MGRNKSDITSQRGNGNELFFTQLSSFHSTTNRRRGRNTLQTMKKLILPTNSLGFHPPRQVSGWPNQTSNGWSIQTSSLLMVRMKFLFIDRFRQKIQSSNHVNVESCASCQVMSTQSTSFAFQRTFSLGLMWSYRLVFARVPLRFVSFFFC